jgi:imidazolonepropionase-like amidohydrolase
MMTLFKNAKVFDGGGGVIDSGWMHIEGDTIVDTGPMGRIPATAADTEIIDVSGQTLFPGLIDGHVHICLDGSPDPLKTAGNQSEVPLALLTAGHMARTLSAGFTTVRDLGGPNFVNIAVRNAIKSGNIPGPRIICAGQNICMTGGHGWRMGRQADGVDEIRRAVREQTRAGADQVKFMATGGVLTEVGKPGQVQLTEEELKAGIEEANRAGLKTSTHAKGLEGIKNAVRAGIDTIEHGDELDDEVIDDIINKGIYVVPTLTAGVNIIAKGTEGGVPGWAVEKARQARPQRLKTLRKARKAGINIGYGTDAGTPFNYHGDNAAEFIHLANDAGFSPMETLMMATSVNADMLGLGDTIGRLTKGFLADFIVVQGDPVSDPTVLTNHNKITAVYQSGKKVAEKGRLLFDTR